MTDKLNRIDEILDEYNEHKLNLEQLDDEVALHIEDELKAEFMDLANDLCDPQAGCPVTHGLAEDWTEDYD